MSISIKKSHNSGLYKNFINLKLELIGDNVYDYGIGQSLYTHIQNQVDDSKCEIFIDKNCLISYYIYEKNKNKLKPIDEVELLIFSIEGNS